MLTYQTLVVLWLVVSVKVMKLGLFQMTPSPQTIVLQRKLLKQ